MNGRIKNIRKTSVLFWCLMICSAVTCAQESILESYIKTGLENNLALKQKEADLKKSILAINEARSHFLPSLNFSSRYTMAKGGRTIDFPVGDLLNPVYTTLNQLTGSNSFPQLENQEFPFYRPQEQETKVELIQPLFNYRIYLIHNLSKTLSEAEVYSVETYKRKLVAEIKSAYYNYLKAVKYRQLLDEISKLLEENSRVSQKLFDIGKVTIDVVSRSKYELSKLETEKTNADKLKATSQAYFNFLLNRNREDEIVISEPAYTLKSHVSLQDAIFLAINKRDELKLLDQYNNASQTAIKLNKASNYPALYFVGDYGFQSESYQFNNENEFMMASIVLKWDLFKGMGTNAAIQQSKVEYEKQKLKLEETKKLIELEVLNAWYELEQSGKAAESARLQVDLARQNFRIINKQYTEGQKSQLEFLDAQSQYTESEIQLLISEYNIQVAFTDFERVTAQYEFK